jgi:hypothetical protein
MPTPSTATAPSSVLLFQGHSDFDSVNAMVAACADALAQLGFAPTVLDVRAADHVARALAVIRSGRLAFTLCLSGLGLPEEGFGEGFYAETDAPVVALWLDHPVFLYPRLRLPVTWLVSTFPAPHHVTFCRAKVRGDRPALHLAHGAAPRPIAPWRERDIPVLFSGSALLPDPETTRAGWADAYGVAVAKDLNAVVETHVAAPARPLEEVIAAVVGDRPVEKLYAYYKVADDYLRSRAKVVFLNAAAKLSITVVGRGWQGLAAGHDSRLKVLSEMPAPGVAELMARSRVVLNLLPPYFGSHERPFQAMAAGAAAATLPLSWFDSAVAKDAYLALPYESAACAEALAAALSDDDRLTATAAAGTAAFLAGHTWRHRMADLVAALNVSLSAAERGRGKGPIDA